MHRRTAFGVAGLLFARLHLRAKYPSVPVEWSLSPDRIAHQSGHAYFIDLRGFPLPFGYELKGDDNDNPRQSTLTLARDGQPLGPPHSVHETIANKGAGAYSHWQTGVYFSTPGNSDPRSDGNSYTLRASIQLRETVRNLLTFAAIVLALPLGYAALRRRGAALLPIVMTFGAVLFVFAIGEAYFRVTVPFTSKNLPTRYVDNVGLLFEPNIVIRHTNDLDFWIEETTNALGFLDREQSSNDPRKSCRIALIGDSFVEAAQVRNHEKVQALLERSAGLVPQLFQRLLTASQGQDNSTNFLSTIAS